jgi:hypothetical protein
MRRIHTRRNCKLARGIFVERHISSKMFRWNSAWAGEAHAPDVSEMPSANHPWTERAVFGHLKRNVPIAHDNHWRVAVDVAEAARRVIEWMREHLRQEGSCQGFERFLSRLTDSSRGRQGRCGAPQSGVNYCAAE